MSQGAKRRFAAADVALRAAAGLLGGYAVAHLLSAAGAKALFASGAVTRPDAVLIATCLALFACPAMVVWSFAARRAWPAAAAGLLAAAASWGVLAA